MLAITMLAVLAGCATGFLETKSGDQIARVYEATQSPIEDGLATLEIYNAGIPAANEVCADPETPLKPCEAALAAVNATEGAASIAANLWGEAEAWRVIYVEWQGSKEDPAFLRTQTAFNPATTRAVTAWLETKLRIERSIATFGKVGRVGE